MTLVFFPMSPKISGMCVKIDDTESLIAINSKLTYGRQRFTASHELYHLNFQENFQKVICGIDFNENKDEEERNADAFASFFLAPSEALTSFISNVLKKVNIKFDISDIVKIEQFFGMSRRATLYRLLKEELITKDIAESLKTNVISSARKLGADENLYQANPEENLYSTTGSYIALVEKLIDKGLISKGKYEEYLLEAHRPDIVYNLSANDESSND